MKLLAKSYNINDRWGSWPYPITFNANKLIHENENDTYAIMINDSTLNSISKTLPILFRKFSSIDRYIQEHQTPEINYQLKHTTSHLFTFK